LAEPSSNARQGSAAVAGYRYLLAGFLPQIERVIIAGHPTLHRSITALLTRKDKEIIAVKSSGQWPDPGWGVSRVLPQVQLSMGDPGWMNTWASADGRLRTKINEHLSWGGQALAASVVEALGDGDALVLGASHPIRDADMAPISPAPPRVYANRGLAGIDGTIATATGIATGLGTPVVALMGDLTAFHDLTSLAVPALETSSDLSVVVADDNGGSIFAGMEYGASRVRIGTYADYFERLFAVPSRINLADVARGFSVPVVEVNSPAQLSAALTTPWSGVRFLHVPLERQSRVNQERDLVQWGREALTEMES
jgi:2-succinyl-5-enolpyruvyl-6-hydroxy-3-cyclohexene-1-carboxylate synthase